MTRKLVFRVHVIRRMFERHISVKDVRGVLMTGEAIERYDNDKPYPTQLVLGFVGTEPLHVVVANREGEAVVITVYVPGSDQWDSTFKRRKLR